MATPQNVRKNLTAIIQTSLTAQALDFGLTNPDSIFLNVAMGTSHRFVGSGGVAPYSFTIAAGAVPGVALNTNGTLTGTPTTQGVFNLTVQIQDSLAQTFLKTFAINVQAVLFWLAGGRDPLPAAQRTVAYQFQFRVADATGSTAGITYSITSGALPAGLSLSAGGLITGTPTVVGTQRIQVSATKAGAGTLTWWTQVSVVQRINTVGTGIVIPTQLRNAVIGVPVDAYITFSSLNGSPPYWYEITASALPAGWVMDSTGHVTGTATALTGALYTQPTITVHDSFGQSFAATPAGNNAIHVRPAVSLGNPGTFVVTNLAGTDQTNIDYLAQFFGDGSDGNVTISSGTTTLGRHTYYDTLILSGTGKLDTRGYDVYCRTLLDLTAAGATAIYCSNGAGALPGTVSGSGGAFGANGGAAVAGGINAGTTGLAGGQVKVGVSSGAQGGPGGAGNPGTLGPVAAVTFPDIQVTPPKSFNSNDVVQIYGGQTVATTVNDTQPLGAGCGGGSGGGGGGNGTLAGGQSGQGGGAGGRVRIFARNIARGAGTAASAIDAGGFKGDVGLAGPGINRGAGGGGAGGGGGYVHITHAGLTGATATNCVDVTGGDGGNGGNSGGSGSTLGQGGNAAPGGAVLIEDLFNATSTTFIGAAGVVHSGQTGATATLSRTNL